MKQRSLRRAAERQTAKLSRKQLITAPVESPSLPTQNPKQGEGQRISPKPEFEQVPHTAARNRSTGTRTMAGKAISCLNHTKHGLTGIFRVHESESQEQFDELRDALREEHAPTTPTELLLVDRISEHAWLSQRAQRIGDAALTDHSETWFALMLRYRTTHDRAFHKCLAELRTLRRERDLELKQAEAHRPLDAVPDERGTSRVWPHLASPLCASSLEQFESQNHVAVPKVPVEAAAKTAPDFDSQTPTQTPKRYTEAELDRLSHAEISALVQAALQKANISLSDFEDCDDEAGQPSCARSTQENDGRDSAKPLRSALPGCYSRVRIAKLSEAA